MDRRDFNLYYGNSVVKHKDKFVYIEECLSKIDDNTFEIIGRQEKADGSGWKNADGIKLDITKMSSTLPDMRLVNYDNNVFLFSRLAPRSVVRGYNSNCIHFYSPKSDGTLVKIGVRDSFNPALLHSVYSPVYPTVAQAVRSLKRADVGAVALNNKVFMYGEDCNLSYLGIQFGKCVGGTIMVKNEHALFVEELSDMFELVAIGE